VREDCVLKVCLSSYENKKYSYHSREIDDELINYPDWNLVTVYWTDNAALHMCRDRIQTR